MECASGDWILLRSRTPLGESVEYGMITGTDVSGCLVLRTQRGEKLVPHAAVENVFRVIGVSPHQNRVSNQSDRDETVAWCRFVRMLRGKIYDILQGQLGATEWLVTHLCDEIERSVMFDSELRNTARRLK